MEIAITTVHAGLIFVFIATERKNRSHTERPDLRVGLVDSTGLTTE